MAVADPQTDWRAVLERSGLFVPEQLAAFCTGPDPDEWFRRLREAKLLTPFQDEQLRKGRFDSFFLAEKYKILDYIGSGGMGKVYLCEHMLLHRLVAVKLLHLPAGTSHDAARAFERFYREARAVAALNDPNIIRVFDVDRAAGTPFMVMEHADGTNLHDIVHRHGPMEFHRAADYVRQAALGLQHAFEIGLVHRDVKPGNLILDRSGTIKLLDLGLARFSQDQSRNHSITEKYDKHVVLGTVDFMAPEQAFHPELVDIRSDIYGLGCTLYFLVTGHVPFPDRTAPEKMYAHKTRAPAPVSEICPLIPFELLTTLERMMAKEPDERFQTPADVVFALAEFAGQASMPPSHEMPEHSAAYYRMGASPDLGTAPGDAVTPNPLLTLDTDRAPKPRWTTAPPTPRPVERGPSTDEAPAIRIIEAPSRRRRWLIRASELFVFIAAAGIVAWAVSKNRDDAKPDPGAVPGMIPKPEPAPPFAGVILNSGGSTFAHPVMQRWAKSYEQAHRVRIDYRPVGSGKGVQGVLDRFLAFGCSDVPLSDVQMNEIRSRGEIIHVPLAMGAVVAAYNLPDVADRLQFTGPVLADIYLGKITHWNDPALSGCNPGVKLPNLPIAIVRRSDSSGTTFIWTDYLGKISADWRSKIGARTDANWQVGIAAVGNHGMATAISRQVGALGYLEQSYAVENNLPVALVKNKEGKFTAPSPESVAAAAAAITISDDLRFSLTDAPGEAAYPIAGVTWAILFQDQTNHPGGKDLVAFLRWAAHEGQALVAEIGFAPLPAEIVKRVDQKLTEVRVK